jgi:hypothetical protein
MSTKYRPGSRVQQVWEVYEKEGADGATAFGKGLGLADGTLKGWMRMWSTGIDKKAKMPSPPISTKPPTKVIRTSRSMLGKERIRVIGIEGEAYLIAQGPDQSEIRWVHNGNQVVIPNDWIEAESSEVPSA